VAAAAVGDRATGPVHPSHANVPPSPERSTRETIGRIILTAVVERVQSETRSSPFPNLSSADAFNRLDRTIDIVRARK
jgi:hypothetical protein